MLTIKNVLKLTFIGLVIFAFQSCKKDDHDHDANDSNKPTVSVTNPSDFQSFNLGDTVKIRGQVADKSLHELLVKIVDDSSQAVLFSEAPTVHDMTSFSLNSNWKSLVSKLTSATVVVVAEDHNSNVAADTVRIILKP